MPVLMTRCMLYMRARGAGSLLRTSAQCMGCTVCEHVCLDWAWMRKDEDVLDDEPHEELAPVEGLKGLSATCNEKWAHAVREISTC
jgi:formate hydrogenlyase subunit 6/NADH:ubiquinone oxidoreductase subunit I